MHSNVPVAQWLEQCRAHQIKKENDMDKLILIILAITCVYGMVLTSKAKTISEMRKPAIIMAILYMVFYLVIL